MADNDLYPIVSYEPDEFNAIVKTLDAGLKDKRTDPGYTSVQEGLAKSIVGELAQDQPDNPDYASYDKMLEGTAGIYKHPGLFPDASPTEIRRILAGMDVKGEGEVDPNLVREGIIKLFAFDSKGRPVQSGEDVLGEAAKRGLMKGVSNTALFLSGAALTNSALQAFPLTATPVTGPQAFVRIVGPVVGGGYAVYQGAGATDFVTDYALGERSLLIPGTDYYYNVVERISEDAPTVFLPLGASKKGADLGAKAIIDRTTPREISKTAFGRKDPSVLGGLEAFKRRKFYVAPGKRPIPETRALKITHGAEELINRMRKDVAFGRRRTPEEIEELQKRYPGQEISPWAYPIGPLASEAGSLGLGSLSAEEVKQEGGSPLMEFVAEAGGNITGGFFMDTFVRRAAFLGSLAKDANRRRKEAGGIRPAITSAWTARREANEAQVGNFLWDFISRYGEDPTQIIKDIESGELDDAIEAYVKANPGVNVDVLTAMKSRSPAMLALSKAVADSTGGLKGSLSANNVKISEGVRLYLRGLYATGDADVVSQVAATSRDAFETQLQTRMDQQVENVTDAFLRVTGKKSVDELNETQMSSLGGKIFRLVNDDYKRSVARRKYLYNAVPEDLVVRDFKDVYGNPVERPNVVSMWDEALNPDLKFSNAEDLKALKDLIGYSRSRAKALNVPFDSGNVTNVGSSRFEKLYEEARNTEAGKQFDYYMRELGLNDDSPETIKTLNELIQMNQPRADRPSDLSNLLRAKKQQLLDLKKDASEIGEGITVKSLDKIRSTALEIAARSKREYPNRARLAEKFAEAAKADMDSLPEGANFELDIARAYNKAHQDVYGRSFASDVLKVGRDRGLVIDPSELGPKIFSAGSLKSRQLADIGKFNASQFLTTMFTGVPQRGKELSEDYLQTVIDPQSRTIDLKKAREWLAANGDELKELPGFKFSERLVGDGPDAKTILEVQQGGTLYDNMQDALQDAVTVRGTLENVLRQIRAEAMGVAPNDPNSVRGISLKAITDWMNKSSNKEILAAYPDLKDDLTRLASGDESALVLLKKTEEKNAKDLRDKKQAFSFYQLLPDANETPVKVVTDSITSRDRPLTRLDGYWKVITDAPDQWKSKIDGETYTKADAKAGFKSAIVDSILLNSGATEKDFDALGAYRKLFSPMQYAKERKSLADWLVDNDIFTETETKNIENFLGRAVELNETVFAGRPGEVEKLMNKMGASADLILSVLGSSAGARLQKLLPGEGGTGTLIASGRGAKVFRESYKDVFEKAPSVLKMDILKKAMEEPEFMAQLLRRGKTDAEKNRIGGAIVQSLILDGYLAPTVRRPVAYTGISTVGEETVDETPVETTVETVEQVPAPPPQSKTYYRAPVAPGGMGVPRPQPNVTPYYGAPVAPGGMGAPQTSSAGPVDRARFAAVFPEDRELLGIGSLMG